MAETPSDPATQSSAYVIEFVGKLPRREAEALALELRQLAGRHGLKVEGFKVSPLVSVPETGA